MIWHDFCPPKIRKRPNKEEAHKKKKKKDSRLSPDSCFLLGVLYRTGSYIVYVVPGKQQY